MNHSVFKNNHYLYSILALLNGQNYKESIYFKILKNYGYEFPESQDFTWINCLGNIEIVLGTNGPDEEIILNSLGMKKNKNQRSSAQKKPSTIIHIVSKGMLTLKTNQIRTFLSFNSVEFKLSQVKLNLKLN